MRICFLANGRSIHSQRWVRYFVGCGHDVHLISLAECEVPSLTGYQVVRPLWPKYLGYIVAAPRIVRAVRRLRPDILNAHYATSYGLFGAVSGYRPLVISAWGTDVLVVPKRFRFLKSVIGLALKRADLVTSVANH